MLIYIKENFYYNLIERMSKPPNGYYFKKDLQEFKLLMNIN